VSPEPRFPRRTLLAGAGAALAAAATGSLLEAARRGSALGYDGQTLQRRRVEPVTANDDFYVVTKNLIDPSVRRGLWRLQVTGRCAEPHTYDFDELARLPAREEEITLECISNRVGGGLISNARWTGVRLRDVLEASRPDAEAEWVLFHAADGYTHSTPLEAALDEGKLVAYRMNGEPLPDRHGYPVRILHPGGYGELSVKWVDRIELAAAQEEGYYERQGWSAQRVHTMSRIDDPRTGDVLPAGRRVEVRGIAFAGDRGISRVEVSTDDGGTWEEAELDYAPSRLAWALWSFGWEPSGPGEHVLAVRATGGDGEPQETERGGIAPDGATGIHRRAVRVEG
jgi:DMSO/TMAO reductase YedYZ molybdopterin-dependent catalytic subunit